MNHTGFLELHANYAAAMRAYFSEMEKTARMLEECTAEPLSFKDRFGLISQAIIESDAHLTFLGAKSLLFNAARLGYGVSN
jgi:hypothetical protein